MPPQNFLKAQLEEERFQHALAYVRNESKGLKILSTSELVRLNQHLTGSKSDPWRTESTQVQLPTGDIHHFLLVTNPLQKAREIIGNAQLMAGNKDLLAAATYLYSQMVLEHLFIDANRRTAVLAVMWLMSSYDQEVDAEKLINIPIGNIRNKTDLEKLRQSIQDSFLSK